MASSKQAAICCFAQSSQRLGTRLQQVGKAAPTINLFCLLSAISTARACFCCITAFLADRAAAAISMPAAHSGMFVSFVSSHEICTVVCIRHWFDTMRHSLKGCCALLTSSCMTFVCIVGIASCALLTWYMFMQASRHCLYIL